MGNQFLRTIPFGWMPAALNNGSGTLALSGSGASKVVLAMSFIAEDSSLSEIGLYCSAMTGTASDRVDCEIYADSAGVPTGAALETVQKTTGLTGATYHFWSGFTCSLTIGNRYHAVLRNMDSVDTNARYPTYLFYGSMVSHVHSSNGAWGWAKRHSTDSGTTFTASPISNIAGLRVKYGDNTFAGLTAQGSVFSGSIYSGRMAGATFVNSHKLRIAGLAIEFGVIAGTPPTALTLRLYNNTTLLAETNPIPAATSSAVLPALFTDAYGVQEVAASTTLRVVAYTSGGDASNYYRLRVMTSHNDSDSLALKPLGASYTYYDGSSWADTTTTQVGFAVLLDADNLFGAAGGTTIAGTTIQRGMVS